MQMLCTKKIKYKRKVYCKSAVIQNNVRFNDDYIAINYLLWNNISEKSNLRYTFSFVVNVSKYTPIVIQNTTANFHSTCIWKLPTKLLLVKLSAAAAVRIIGIGFVIECGPR